MKITIDTQQTPQALLNDFTQAIRVALGARFYIDESDSAEPNFTHAEVADPNVNLAPVVAGASTATTPTTAASVPPANNGAETDSQGNVWDVRIHSGGKSKIADGTWKLKKGVDKALVDQINAQNRQLLATPLPSAASSNVVSLPVAALPTLEPVVAALPTLPPVAQVAAPDVEIVVTDYPTFAQFVAQQMLVKPTVTKNQCDVGLNHYGIVTNGQPDLAALQHRPEVVMPLYTWLKAVIDLTAEPT